MIIGHKISQMGHFHSRDKTFDRGCPCVLLCTFTRVSACLCVCVCVHAGTVESVNTFPTAFLRVDSMHVKVNNAIHVVSVYFKGTSQNPSNITQ